MKQLSLHGFLKRKSALDSRELPAWNEKPSKKAVSKENPCKIPSAGNRNRNRENKAGTLELKDASSNASTTKKDHTKTTGVDLETSSDDIKRNCDDRKTSSDDIKRNCDDSKRNGDDRKTGSDDSKRNCDDSKRNGDDRKTGSDDIKRNCENQKIETIHSTEIIQPQVNTKRCKADSLESSVENEEKSEYEIQRLENIKKNEEFLKSIGLSSSSSLSRKKVIKSKPSKRKRPRTVCDGAKDEVEMAGGLRRRSRRLRGINAQAQANDIGMNQSHAGIEEIKKEEEEKEVYVESSLKQILNESFKLENITDCHGELFDPAMKRAYSIDFHRNLVVAGGHGGRLSIYNRNKSVDSSPEDSLLMSFKASKGWISNVQFLSQPNLQINHTYILSSSNDGSLLLWDANQESLSGGAYKVSCCNPNGGGIFSMHEMHGKIATASKNSSISISNISQSGELGVVKKYENWHDGVVKCVALQENSQANIFASCGNDSIIKVTDARTPADSLDILDTHAGRCINSVRWHPCDDKLLASTSFNREIIINDIRAPKTPLFTLDEHVPPSVTSLKSIYHPVFYDSGKYLIATGEKSTFLTTYDLSTGKVASREDIDVTCTSLKVDCMRSKEPTLAAAHGKSITLMKLVTK